MESNGIFIGFDGGGSTSRFLVRRSEGKPESHTFAMNMKYSDIGVGESVKIFADRLHEILGEEVSDLKAICISLSGASDVSKNREFEQAVRMALQLPKLRLQIESDSAFTLETAYPSDKSGILLIAGTGSVAVAKKRNGEIVKVGGWGRLLGDEGSGYWIGLQALKHYCKVMDGAETAGELFANIGKKLHEESASDLSPLRSKLYRDQIKPQFYASLVFKSLPHDPVSEDILVEAAGHLMADLEILWNKVSGMCEPVVVLHGAIARQSYIFDYIKDHCETLNLSCSILEEEKVLSRALNVSLNLE